MATAALAGASMMASVAQTGAENKALRQRQSAANDAASREVAELQRQTERDKEVAAEQKSDRAREMDRMIGSLVAASADGGGTPNSLANLVGASAAAAGLDMARIEGNRFESAMARHAASISIIEENRAQRKQTQGEIKSNTLEMISDVAGAGFSIMSSGTSPQGTKGLTGGPRGPLYSTRPGPL